MEAIGAYPAGVIDIEELYREAHYINSEKQFTVAQNTNIATFLQDRVQRPAGERHLQRHVHRLHDGLGRGGPRYGRARYGLTPRRHRRKCVD